VQGWIAKPGDTISKAFSRLNGIYKFFGRENGNPAYKLWSQNTTAFLFLYQLKDERGYFVSSWVIAPSLSNSESEDVYLAQKPFTSIGDAPELVAQEHLHFGALEQWVSSPSSRDSAAHLSNEEFEVERADKRPKPNVMKTVPVVIKCSRLSASSLSPLGRL